MHTYTIHGADPMTEITAIAIHHGLIAGAKIQAAVRGTDKVLHYVWMGSKLRYMTKGEGF